MSKNSKWTVTDIPPQHGRVALVTGANSGLGYYTARALALKGASVIMACRDLTRGEEARKMILLERPEIEPEVWQLNLADLDSVGDIIEKYNSVYDRLDLLINNAGIMAVPYGKTSHGFEMQFGVNHLAHFALTAGLWKTLVSTGGSRVVNVSSSAHNMGKIRFDDIHWEKKYSKWGAYGMSKLANLLFTRELANRISASGHEVISCSAHPGYASTELQAKGYIMAGARIRAGAFNVVNRLVAQSAEMGALPSLYAATAEGVGQGSYFGPDGFMRLTGNPVPDRPNRKLVTDEVASKLWELSESLTGIVFTLN